MLFPVCFFMGFLILVSLQWQFTLAVVGPSGSSHWFQFSDFPAPAETQCAFLRHQIKPVGSFPQISGPQGLVLLLLWAQKHHYQVGGDWLFEAWVSAACDGAFPSFLSFSNSLSSASSGPGVVAASWRYYLRHSSLL